MTANESTENVVTRQQRRQAARKMADARLRQMGAPRRERRKLARMIGNKVAGNGGDA